LRAGAAARGAGGDRLMRIADLDARRVAVWGFGGEGRAAIRAIRAALPGLPLAVYCGAAEADAVRAFDPTLAVHAREPDAGELAAFEVVVKSPGVSRYKPVILAAAAEGTHFTSGTALWFGDHSDARVVAVTGTKGKSTTTALIAHLARALHLRTALAGNIGLPLLDLGADTAALWAIELSSFQTGEAGPLELGVVTSLYEEHLDWHGSRERYVANKLKLADRARTLLVNGTQPELLERTARHPRRIAFGTATGWYVDGGWIRCGGRPVFDLAHFAVPGAHNALNACAALAALEALGLDADAAAPALAAFHPLPHRLQPLGERDGWQWINDSIATTPEATLAALASLAGHDVTVIVGGHDRGVDWSHFVHEEAHATRLRIVAQGANGPRIARELRAAGITAPLIETATLDAAVAAARDVTPPGGTILLSPGAPSFDQFRNYAARGRHFADLAGFDGERIAGIPGLGIA